MILTRRRLRLSRRAGLVLAAVLVAVVAEVSLQTWWLPSKWRGYDASATGQIELGEDGRTIGLAVDWQCEQRPDLEVRESADRVTVVLHRRAFKGPTYQCPEDAVGSARLSSRLRAPLASRSLVDAVTGLPLSPHRGSNGS
ncbi:hypothetical protein [Kitasatospora purpeofusca]|uniref:hypothetical protein n=1 Tax=Kitasatospora purpeofusca TaxID=67352 RepID=UPI00386BA501|nr:hypothetical protein OIP63_31685 [Kitasatospora purpeofusca]